MDFGRNITPKQVQIDSDRQPKIPRPANAFMLYANENRKKMACMFPLDSNKEISKRLGKSWKELNQEQRGIYFLKAKKVDAEHKLKYPDYVYNPKEARIRKAMRDAHRERTMGVAPSNRAGRRSQPWVVRDQDEFMLNAAHGMRSVASPICGNGFPITGNASNGQFMGPMHSYNKHIHLAPHEQSYLQANPMAQLQHQTEMWHYHENANTMRPQTGADQFILTTANQMPNYHHNQQQQHPAASHDIDTEKLKPSINEQRYDEAQSSNSPHTNENVSPNSDIKPAINELPYEGNKTDEVINSNGVHSQLEQQEKFMDMFPEDVVLQNPFEKDDNTAMKKNTSSLLTTKTQKPLPDFNEAFGSTERGRFQSRPDPQIPLKQTHLDFFTMNSDLKFDDFHI